MPIDIRVKGGSSVAETNTEKKETAPASTETVLIAEDSAPNKKILEHLLKKLGYEVIACDNGAEAWNKLSDPASTNIVAVISDMMMPEMDGLTLLKNIRESDKLKELPFVFVSAVSDKEQIVQAKALKINGYILKPVSFQKVFSKMKELFPNKAFPKVAA